MALTKIIGTGVQGIVNASDATFLTVTSAEGATLAGTLAVTGVHTVGNNPVATSEGGAVTHNITQGLLKHWINFGMDDAAINDSFNNTSVADIANGDYTVTIANNFANAVYAISLTHHYVAGHGTVGHQNSDTTKTTTLVRVYAFTTNTGGAADTVEAMVHSAGDLA